MTMKKTILTVAASLFFGAAVVFAQDTTRTEQQRDQQTQTDRYRTEGMVEVQQADLPEAVSQTLKDTKYSGWEEGKIYLDPESGEYLLEIEKDGQAAQHFRFDRNGTDVTDRDAQGQQNQQQGEQREGDQNQQQTDPMNQETDTTSQQGEDQNQYNQQQNDQENQNDDAAVQSDTTQTDDAVNQEQDQNREQSSNVTEGDSTQMNQETDANVQGQEGQREDETVSEDSEKKNEGAVSEDAAQRTEEDANYKKEEKAADTGANEGAATSTAAKKEVGSMEGHYKVIDQSELPQEVVSKLDEEVYGGWKDNTVYLDTKTGDYIVQAKGEGREGMYYRISKEGKDISKHRKQNKEDKQG
jgi:hypothetical protein